MWFFLSDFLGWVLRGNPLKLRLFVIQGGGDLLVKTQALYFQRENAGGGTAALVEAVAMDAWER